MGWVDEARFTVEQVLALMDEAGVDRALLVQPLTAYGYDNRYTALSARRYPDRFVSVPIVDMEADGAAETLRSLNENEGMTGVRLFGRAGGGDWLDNPKTFPVWELAEELDFPIAVLLGIERAPKLAAMLERFPGVTVASTTSARSRSKMARPTRPPPPSSTSRGSPTCASSSPRRTSSRRRGAPATSKTCSNASSTASASTA